MPGKMKLSQLLADYCELTQNLLQAAEKALWEEVVALCEQRQRLEPDLLAMWQVSVVGTEEKAQLSLAFKQTQQVEALMLIQHEELSQKLQAVRQSSRLGQVYNSV
ncbi:MAG TPA: hypothetical protein VJ575_06860 [Pseudogulbenkiania sp.]|nr:hypothetical protein [Pseudogulbenkiania sp.]